MVYSFDIWQLGYGGDGGLFRGLAPKEVRGRFREDDADREVGMISQSGYYQRQFDGGNRATLYTNC